MTNALDWIRNKARQVSVETNVELGDARYNITHHTFCGTIPPRMVYEVRKLYGDLKTTDEINESLRVGGEYRSQFGQCEYHRRVYERVA